MHPFDGDGMAGKPSRAMGCQLKGFRFHPEKQWLIDENRRIRKIMIRKIADRSKTSKLPIESHPAEEKPLQLINSMDLPFKLRIHAVVSCVFV